HGHYLLIGAIRLRHLLRVRCAAMNPHAVAAAKGFTRLEGLWLHAGPAEAQHAVVPGQPLGRKIWMVRRDEDGGAAGLRTPREARGEIGPRQPRDGEILVPLAQWRGDDGLSARRETKRQSAVALVLGAFKRKRFAEGSPRQFNIQRAFVFARRTGAEPDLFPNDFAVA